MNILLRSKSTGVYSVIDTHAQRVKHMRARLLQWASTVNNIDDNQKNCVRYVGVTLTYAPNREWSADHIRACLDTVRHSLGDYLIAYAWVAELQRRGAVHYHLAMVVGRGASIPKFDKAGWWSHGSTKIQTLKHVSGSYLIKYLQKSEDLAGNRFPKHLRIFAAVVRKCALVSSIDRLKFRLSAAVGRVRKFVNENLELSSNNNDWSWKPHLGAWWVWCKFSLFVLPSDWGFEGVIDFNKYQPWFLDGSARRNYALSVRHYGLYRTLQS